MKEHISLELAKWLNERGCGIESKEVYVDTRKSWKEYNCPPSSRTPVFVPFWRLHESSYECELVGNKAPFPNEGYNESKPLPAYTWWEILVKNPERFFGSRVQEGVHPSHAIFYALQEGDVEKAESIVRKHSIFANKQL